MDVYNPLSWFWIVGGDASRAWSSATGAYVLNWPSDRVSRIASEAELVDVLAQHGIEGPLSVGQAKTSYVVRVDSDAERCRLQFITPGAGMAMTYQEKFAQAGAVHALGQAAANALTQAEREQQFPTLSASVGLEAATLWDCAQLVLEKYAQFCALSMVIERTRLAGKAAITAATDVAGVRAAYGAIAWPTP